MRIEFVGWSRRYFPDFSEIKIRNLWFQDDTEMLIPIITNVARKGSTSVFLSTSTAYRIVRLSTQTEI